MHPLFKKHNAILITGPQCSGKTRLANEIAEQSGRYFTITFDAFLKGGFHLSSIFTNYEVVIVDAVTTRRSDPATVMKIHHLIEDKVVTMAIKHLGMKEITVPKLIFISQEPNPFCLMNQNRTFKRVTLK